MCSAAGHPRRLVTGQVGGAAYWDLLVLYYPGAEQHKDAVYGRGQYGFGVQR